MDVVVAGGHGQIGRLLLSALADRGDRARGLIRNAAHADDLRALGAEPVLCDLEDPDADLEAAVAGADAVIFAAGAGPGSGAPRKWTMDLGGAVRLVNAARAAEPERFVMVSSMNADHPERGDGVYRIYLEAKGAADAVLRASGLAYTIVRPGRLTGEAARGRVDAGARLGRTGEIPRADVARMLLAVLDEPRTAGLTFEVLAGDTPVAEAVARIAAG